METPTEREPAGRQGHRRGRRRSARPRPCRTPSSTPWRISASGTSTCPPPPAGLDRDQRSEEASRVKVTITVNGDGDRGRRRGPTAAGALPARRARADRHQHRLRHDLLRRVHGAAGRRVGQVVHGAGRAGRRPAVTTVEGLAGEDGELHPMQRGVPAGARPAVRLLHARHGDGLGVAARREPAPDRGGGARRPGGQPVPLHRLPQHRRGRARRGRRRGPSDPRVLQLPAGRRRSTRPWRSPASTATTPSSSPAGTRCCR